MDTNRTLIKACAASLALLLASGVSAQTIYKQVDDEGRVTFTDRPNPAAKVITSFESRGRPADAPVEARVTTETSLPRTAVSSAGATRPSQPLPMTNDAIAARSNYGEIERAVATYTPLNTPLAAQADATESARRARQEANKRSTSPILVVQATPREHEATAPKSGVDTFYILWVVTFLILAAGLLYVGWQVFRLILGTAFPRFHIGAA